MVGAAIGGSEGSGVTILCECCFCKRLLEATTRLGLPGWLWVMRSPWRGRTHLGWCPECAQRFGVEERSDL